VTDRESKDKHIEIEKMNYAPTAGIKISISYDRGRRKRQPKDMDRKYSPSPSESEPENEAKGGKKNQGREKTSG